MKYGIFRGINLFIGYWFSTHRGKLGKCAMKIFNDLRPMLHHCFSNGPTLPWHAIFIHILWGEPMTPVECHFPVQNGINLVLAKCYNSFGCQSMSSIFSSNFKRVGPVASSAFTSTFVDGVIGCTRQDVCCGRFSKDPCPQEKNGGWHSFPSQFFLAALEFQGWPQRLQGSWMIGVTFTSAAGPWSSTAQQQNMTSVKGPWWSLRSNYNWDDRMLFPGL